MWHSATSAQDLTSRSWSRNNPRPSKMRKLNLEHLIVTLTSWGIRKIRKIRKIRENGRENVQADPGHLHDVRRRLRRHHVRLEARQGMIGTAWHCLIVFCTGLMFHALLFVMLGTSLMCNDVQHCWALFGSVWHWFDVLSTGLIS